MAVYPATKMSNFAYFAYFYSPNPSCSTLTLLFPDYTLQIFCIFLPKNLEKPESSSYLCTAKAKTTARRIKACFYHSPKPSLATLTC